MAGEAWLKGTVPHAYAAQTLRTAKETIEEELKTVEEQQPEGAATLQASLAARARSLVQVVERMRAAVESRDGSNVPQLLKQLETEEQAVKLIAEGGGIQP
jgi:flagellar motility protein MotE (MotC chaperone)